MGFRCRLVPGCGPTTPCGATPSTPTPGLPPVAHRPLSEATRVSHPDNAMLPSLLDRSHVLEVVLRTLVVSLGLLLAVRLAGKHKVGQMKPFDLVTLLIFSDDKRHRSHPKCLKGCWFVD